MEQPLLNSTEDLTETIEDHLQTTEELVPVVPLVPVLSDSQLYHVFLSSSSSDSEWTQSLMEELEALGLKVCYHERDFTPGLSILENMSESIKQSQKVLLLLSPDFVRSRWCLLEANMSMFTDCLQRKPIVPVLLRQVDIPLHLSHLTYLKVGHPSFTQDLLKVLCTPNHQLQGSTVVPYHPPTIYSGKSLQPLTALNEDGLEKYDCGIWSEMQVPDQLRLIIREPQRYLQAISIINKVHREKVRFRSVWSKALFCIGAIILLSSGSASVGMLFAFSFEDSSLQALKVVLIFLATGILIWALVKIATFEKNESKRILGELHKAAGRANCLLFEEKVLLGSDSRSKLSLVYVCVDSCRQWLTEAFPERDGVDAFDKALLDFSSDYTCCLAKRHFPFTPPTEPGHLEGGVCFCQYLLLQNNTEQSRRFNCC